MWQLYQFALCPFSRTVRLLLGEKQIAYDLVQVLPWQLDGSLLVLNPIGQTPVLHDRARGIVLCDSRAICEYLEETIAGSGMLHGSAEQRAEIRRLVAWAEEFFFAQAAWPLLSQLVIEGRSLADCDAGVLAQAARNADPLLDQLGFYLSHRAWVAGPTLSLADLAVAAQISVADYLGGIDWSGHDQVRTWYSVLKSRRSFGPLLAERMPGIEPPPHYPDVNA